MKHFLLPAVLAGLGVCAFEQPCAAQMITTEERFQDLFVTAGYGTAFGAAFGAALLSFQDKPQDNLRFVAIGASVGFIGGSLLGTYVIFSPGIVSSDSRSPYAQLQAEDKAGVRIIPSFTGNGPLRLAHLESQWTLLRF